MGERTPLAALDAPASGRMAVAEAITNLLAAPIELPRVKLSANWMAACGEAGEDAALYATGQGRGLELCPALASASRWARIRCPCARSGPSRKASPGRAGPPRRSHPRVPDRQRLCHAAGCARHADPQLNATEDTTLVLVDLGHGKNRMATSILAQTLDQVGDAVPDLEAPRTW